MEVAMWLLLLISGVHGYSSGADKSACTDLTPGHSPHASQPVATSPYTVSVSSNQYSTGDDVIVTLSGSEPFKGFLLVATSSADGGITSGQFEGYEDQDRNVIQNICNGAATHNSDVDKQTVRLKWTVPADLSGDVYFSATFVKNYMTFWVKLTSGPVTPVGEPENTVIGTLADDVTVNSCESVDGTKSCWGSCVKDACEFLVKWSQDPTYAEKYQFEIFASNVDGYAALGIAPGPIMSDVSIVSCIADEKEGVQQFYAEDRSAPARLETGPIDMRSTKFRYDSTAKTMSCTFTYNNTLAIANPSQWKDLSDGTNFLFLAKGEFSNGQLARHTVTPDITAAAVTF